jgi:hypothetical protein
MTTESFIVASYLITPKGTMLHSKHRHDYVTLEEDGHFFMIDGGNEYVRYSKPEGLEGADLFTVHSDDKHEIIREFMKWGKNYDKDMNRLPETEWVLLKEITDDHLDGILTYLDETGRLPQYVLIFKTEREFRKTLNNDNGK